MKRFLFYILMFVLTIAVCFAILEFAVARFYYYDAHGIRDYVHDDELGWRLKPGTYHIKAPNRFMKHAITINEYGCRGQEITPERRDGVTRIIILGDSFTYGQINSQDEIFPSKLEDLLNGGGDEPVFEVLNAGVMGYGNAQEWLLMKRLAGSGIIGDVYLVMLFTNDILDNMHLRYADLSENPYQPGYSLDDDGRIFLEHPVRKRHQAAKNPHRETTKRPRRAKLARVIKIRIESFLQTKPDWIRALNRIGFDVEFPRIPGLLNAWYHDDVLERGVPLMKALLHEMQEEAARMDATLLVSLIPSQIQIYSEVYGPMLERTFTGNELIDRFMSDQQRPQRTVQSICDELGIPFLDLYPVLHDNNNRSFYIPREGHFNANGHDIVARSLEGFVRDHISTIEGSQ
jgi:lysophospholipase L1-like esterase